MNEIYESIFKINDEYQKLKDNSNKILIIEQLKEINLLLKDIKDLYNQNSIVKTKDQIDFENIKSKNKINNSDVSSFDKYQKNKTNETIQSLEKIVDDSIKLIETKINDLKSVIKNNEKSNSKETYSLLEEQKNIMCCIGALYSEINTMIANSKNHPEKLLEEKYINKIQTFIDNIKKIIENENFKYILKREFSNPNTNVEKYLDQIDESIFNISKNYNNFSNPAKNSNKSHLLLVNSLLEKILYVCKKYEEIKTKIQKIPDNISNNIDMQNDEDESFIINTVLKFAAEKDDDELLKPTNLCLKDILKLHNENKINNLNKKDEAVNLLNKKVTETIKRYISNISNIEPKLMDIIKNNITNTQEISDFEETMQSANQNIIELFDNLKIPYKHKVNLNQLLEEQDIKAIEKIIKLIENALNSKNFNYEISFNSFIPNTYVTKHLYVINKFFIILNEKYNNLPDSYKQLTRNYFSTIKSFLENICFANSNYQYIKMEEQNNIENNKLEDKNDIKIRKEKVPKDQIIKFYYCLKFCENVLRNSVENYKNMLNNSDNINSNKLQEDLNDILKLINSLNVCIPVSMPDPQNFTIIKGILIPQLKYLNFIENNPNIDYYIEDDDIKGDDIKGDDIEGDDIKGDDIKGDDIENNKNVLNFETRLGRLQFCVFSTRVKFYDDIFNYIENYIKTKFEQNINEKFEFTKQNNKDNLLEYIINNAKIKRDRTKKLVKEKIEELVKSEQQPIKIMKYGIGYLNNHINEKCFIDTTQNNYSEFPLLNNLVKSYNTLIGSIFDKNEKTVSFNVDETLKNQLKLINENIIYNTKSTLNNIIDLKIDSNTDVGKNLKKFYDNYKEAIEFNDDKKNLAYYLKYLFIANNISIKLKIFNLAYNNILKYNGTKEDCTAKYYETLRKIIKTQSKNNEEYENESIKKISQEEYENKLIKKINDIFKTDIKLPNKIENKK